MLDSNPRFSIVAKHKKVLQNTYKYLFMNSVINTVFNHPFTWTCLSCSSLISCPEPIQYYFYSSTMHNLFVKIFYSPIWQALCLIYLYSMLNRSVLFRCLLIILCPVLISTTALNYGLLYYNMCNLDYTQWIIYLFHSPLNEILCRSLISISRVGYEPIFRVADATEMICSSTAWNPIKSGYVNNSV